MYEPESIVVLVEWYIFTCSGEQFDLRRKISTPFKKVFMNAWIQKCTLEKNL
jgi:hypothetical protein